MTGAEHLQWCKDRALAYLKDDDVNQAYTSFTSDMRKHLETAMHPALTLGNQMFFSGCLNTTAQMKEWIEGFN